MRMNSWKRVAGAGLVAIALTSCATKGGDGPVFATAEPLAAAKPENFGFKQAIRINAMEGLTETVKRNLTTVLQPEEFTESLRRSLANDQMLAPQSTQAAYELTPTFVDLRTAPVSDRVTAAQAIFQYRVVRIEDDTVIFNKRIKAEFSSIADSAYDDAGFFGRTLRFVGLKKDVAKPAAGARTGREETKGPGPERETAREVHSMRNAIALNMRRAMRHLIAASPERIIAPQPTDGAKPLTRKVMEDEAAPEDETTPEAATDEAVTDTEENETSEDEAAPVPEDNPLPPIAPAQDDPDEDEDQSD